MPVLTWRLCTYYTNSGDVNPALPNSRIEVLGPPPTSGTRDAFAELTLEGGCKRFGWIKQLKRDAKAAKKQGNKALAKKLKSQYKGLRPELCG